MPANPSYNAQTSTTQANYKVTASKKRSKGKVKTNKKDKNK